MSTVLRRGPMRKPPRECCGVKGCRHHRRHDHEFKHKCWSRPSTMRRVLEAKMAQPLYGNGTGRADFRLTPPSATFVTEPIPVPLSPSAPASRNVRSPLGAFSMPESWSELYHMISPSSFPAFSQSPEEEYPWNPCSLGQKGFAKIQRSLTYEGTLSNHSLEQLCSPPLRLKSMPINPPCFPRPLENSALDLEFSHGQSASPSLRRVFSTGDLHKVNSGYESGSPSGNEIFGNGMQKVVPYNAEEKRERIQRYRSKRNHRNFNKKITYACRKTLADSRPRVRGRFARNEEHGDTPQIPWNQIEDDDDEESWMNIFDVSYFPIP